MAATIKLTAIRTQAGWDGMTGPQQAPYEGRHYDSLSAWELTIPDNLVFANEQWVAHCYDDWPTGLVDTVNITSRTVDETRNIVVTTPDDRPAPPTVPPTGFLIVSNDENGDTIYIGCENTVIKNISVEQSPNGSNSTAIGTGAIDITISHCTLYSTVDVGNLILRYVASAGSLIINNFLYGSNRGLNTTAPMSIYNNTFSGQNGNGFYGGSVSSAYVLRNNTFYNIGTACINNRNTSSDMDYNATSDDSATGPNSIINITDIEFVNAAGNDFHLAETSQLRGAGQNLIETGALLTPQYDIDYDQWPDAGPWDMGFDYYTSGEPPVSGGIKLGAINIGSVRVGVNAVDKVMSGLNQVLP